MEFRNRESDKVLNHEEFVEFVWDEAERQFNELHGNETWNNLNKSEQISFYCQQYEHQLNDRDWEEMIEPSNEKMKIDLGYAVLTAEKGIDENYKEVFIGLEDKNGVWLQDLAIVGGKYHYEDDKLIQDEGVSVKVYCDKDDEDYTHEFTIDVYKEKDYEITNIEIQDKGDLKGYAVFVVEVNDVPLEGLYRICDPENGPDMSLVSIDYGAEYEMVERCWDDIEAELFEACYEKYIKILKEKGIVRVCDEEILKLSALDDKIHAKLSERLQNGDFYIRQSDGIGTVVLEMVNDMEQDNLPYMSVALDDMDENGGRIENTEKMKCLWNSVYDDAVDCYEHFKDCVRDFAKSVYTERNTNMKAMDLETKIEESKNIQSVQENIESSSNVKKIKNRNDIEI